MSGIDKIHNVIKILTDSFQVDDEAIEELRVILSEREGCEVSTAQAEEVGAGLIAIVETLANGRPIIGRKEDTP